MSCKKTQTGSSMKCGMYVVCIDNGILFSHGKEGILVIYDKSMHLEGNMLSGIRQKKTKRVCYHLYVESLKQRVEWNIPQDRG